MRDAAGCWLLLRLLPLGEDVPVGAAVLHGDSVATVWCGVADGVERAVLIIISDVLQHRRVPHETKTAVFHLKIKKKIYKHYTQSSRCSERCIFTSGHNSVDLLSRLSKRSLIFLKIMSFKFASKHKWSHIDLYLCVGMILHCL